MVFRGLVFLFFIFLSHVLWAETPPQEPRLNEQMQNLIYYIEEHFAGKMSHENLQRFQMFVARVGGKLKQPLLMPEGGTSFWLQEPHPTLSHYQSTENLPSQVDVAIIGAGLGGLAAAERLSQ